MFNKNNLTQAVKTELQFNTTISAHPTTLGRFNTSDYLFYQNVRREGIEV
ncbi:MAG: hypothetical protein KA138_10610 [Saprospiraceae bacterium]|nr:hypothetical protein [Saprospiraceae bacterium]